jgi:hypothetical protein
MLLQVGKTHMSSMHDMNSATVWQRPMWSNDVIYCLILSSMAQTVPWLQQPCEGQLKHTWPVLLIGCAQCCKYLA